MITISMYGLDQFVVGRYSRENTANLANLMEVDSSKINFCAPNSMVFHEGVEQTSWNTIVIVRAPLKLKVLESKIADYIMKTITLYTINVSVDFEYFEQDSHYEKINNEYPRFISADKSELPSEDDEVEEECECEDEECECGHHHEHGEDCDCHHEDEEEIYLGNAFEGFEERLAEAQKKKN